MAEVEWRSEGEISFPEATTKGPGVELSSLRFGVQVEASFLALARESERVRERDRERQRERQRETERETGKA